MDIIENIEIPSFERRRDRFRRGVTLLTGTVAIALAIERYNQGVTRALKAVKRGAAAAIMTWMEDRSGTRLFTLEGDEPPPLSMSALRLSAQRVANARGLGRAALPQRPKQADNTPDPVSVPAGRTVSDQLPVVVTVPEVGGVGPWEPEYGTFPLHYHMEALQYGPAALLDPSVTPHFFQSTKFFAVLTVDQARELFEATTRVTLKPREVLFTAGESSEAGIFIVTHGQLGVFLPVKEGVPPVHANTLRYGESVGDLDVVDGAPRSVTCIALDEGCTVVQLPRALFMAFVHAHPQALTQYLQQGLARLWRVAHFMLAEYLAITLHKPEKQQRQHSRSHSQHPLHATHSDGVARADISTQTGQDSDDSEATSDTHTATTLPVPILQPTGPNGLNTMVFHTGSLAPPVRVSASRVPPHNIGTINEEHEEGPSAQDSHAAASPAPHTPQDRSAPAAAPAPMLSAFAALAAEVQGGGSEGGGTMADSSQTQGDNKQIQFNPQEGMSHQASLAAPRDQGQSTDEEAAVTAGLSAAAAKLTFIQEQQQVDERRAQRQRIRKQYAAARLAAAKAVPLVVGPTCRIQRSPTLRQAFQYGQRACLAGGWDVVDADEFTLSERAWARLADSNQELGALVSLPRGGVLQEIGWACGQFYLLLDGHLQAERQVTVQGTHTQAPTSRTPSSASRGAHTHSGGGLDGIGGANTEGGAGHITEIGIIRPGSAISCAAFLSYTQARCRIVALEPARLLAFNWSHLESIAASNEPRATQPTHVRPPARPVSQPTHTEGSASSAASSSVNSARDGPTAAATTSAPTNTTGGGPAAGGGSGKHAAAFHTGEAGRNPDVDDVLIPLLVAAAAAMGPIIRRFISLGLNRVWLKSGEFAYKQGEDATCLYVVMSGRLRLLHEQPHPVSGAMQQTTEEEVGRCEAVGVVFTIAGGQHDTSAVCVRDSELVRMSKAAFQLISEDSPMALSRLFANVSRRMMAAWEARMRQPRVPRSLGFARAGGPGAGMQRLDAVGSGTTAWSPHSNRADVVTIAIMPAGVMEGTVPRAGGVASAAIYNQVPSVAGARALHRLANRLKEELMSQLAKTGEGESGQGSQHGSPRAMGKSKSAQKGVLVVNSTTMGVKFGSAFDKLDILFYRSKITSWLSNQEDDYRFIILEGDYAATHWSSVCLSQADVILLVAAEGAKPQLSEVESRLVWCTGAPLGPSRGLSTMSSLSRSAAAAHSTPSVAAAAAPTAAPAPTLKQLLHGHDDEVDSPAPATAAGGGAAGGASARVPVNSVIAAANAAAAADAAKRRAMTPPPAPQTPKAPVAATTGPGGATGASMPTHTPLAARAGNTFTMQPQPTAAHTGAYSSAMGSSQAPTTSASTSGQSILLPPPPPPVSGPPPGNFGFAPAVTPSPLTLPSPAIPATTRRVELVLLRSSDSSLPHNTREWLENRPYLARHHHIRMDKDEDMARLARWMRGAAVGLVLSGGGSRGLAHLGVLFALEDAGVPVDVIGGTSQGAFMAALYAQGLDREAMQLAVRKYAQALSSVRHLLADLTLPLLSVFSGTKFDEMMKAMFQQGAGNIEDLWLPFFCVSTNLTRGQPYVHTTGCLWQLVRASMTLVGLLPPVCLDGDLLVDGGYMNNIPVDVIRSMGVETVIVVDVESKDDYVWHHLGSFDGGVSGWRLLWDRWCPIPSWRSNKKLPRYAEIINKLTWMTHALNLQRMNEDYHIDLYLRPPNIGSFKLMDFHLMNRIVRDAYKDALNCLHNWSKLPSLCKHHRGGVGGSQPALTPSATHTHLPLAHTHTTAAASAALYRAQSDMTTVYGGGYNAPTYPGYTAVPSPAFLSPYAYHHHGSQTDNNGRNSPQITTEVTSSDLNSNMSLNMNPNLSRGSMPEVPASQLLGAGVGGGLHGGVGGMQGAGVHGGGVGGRYSMEGRYPGDAMGYGRSPQAGQAYAAAPATRLNLPPQPLPPQGSKTVPIDVPGSAARAHSIALAATAELLAGASPAAGAAGGAPPISPLLAGAPSALGGVAIRAPTMLSASAAAAPPPAAAAIASQALARVSYTGGGGNAGAAVPVGSILPPSPGRFTSPSVLHGQGQGPR